MRLFSPKVWGICLTVFALGFAAQPAKAAFTLSFQNVTNNTTANATAGNSQLRVDVSGVGGTSEANATAVSFKFYWVGNTPMSITDVYFEDKALPTGTTLVSSPFGISSTAGVDFSQGATPGNLSGGNAANFQTTIGFSADSAPPAAPNGVDSTAEWLTITLNLASGKTFANLQAAITSGVAYTADYLPDGTAAAPTTSTFRIGLHVQAIGDNSNSESFVNGGPSGTPVPTPAPAPAGFVLLASALPFAFGLRRRLSRREVAA